ncbi:MAG: hypothetical protein AAGE89_08610 [Pseudomonadota bacterium]
MPSRRSFLFLASGLTVLLAAGPGLARRGNYLAVRGWAKRRRGGVELTMRLSADVDGGAARSRKIGPYFIPFGGHLKRRVPIRVGSKTELIELDILHDTTGFVGTAVDVMACSLTTANLETRVRIPVQRR